MNIFDFLNELTVNGWKQKDIAEKCNFTPQHVGHIIRTKKAKLITIERIAKAFDKPVSFFLDEEARAEPIMPRKKQILLEIIGDDNDLLDEAIKHTEKEKLYKETMKKKAA